MNPFNGADIGTSLPRTGKWRVLRPSRMAILDSEFATRATRYPEVVSAPRAGPPGVQSFRPLWPTLSDSAFAAAKILAS
jgi:hypothetical protein